MDRHPGAIPSVLCLALVAGCSSGGGQASETDGAVGVETRPAGDAPDVAARDAGPEAAGTPGRSFVVSVWESCPAAPGGCSAYATAGAGFEPGELEPELAVPPCAFFRPSIPAFCDPPCDPGTVCDRESGTCHEPEPPISAGEIGIMGLKSTCTLVPETRYYYYTPHFDPEPVDGDLFDEGDPITAVASGGEVPPFSISGEGVAALETPLPCPPELSGETPLVVTWTPGGGEGTISFSIQSGNHASEFSRILCETEDSGELVVDATLVAALLEGWHPVWAWSLARRVSRGADVDGTRIGLGISSSVGCMW